MLNRSEGKFHGELQNSRVARAVIFPKKCPQRARGIRCTLAANVVANDHLVVTGENSVAGEEQLIAVRGSTIRHRQVSARVNAGELCLVEDIEGFQTELDIPALVRITDAEFLED